MSSTKPRVTRKSKEGVCLGVCLVPLPTQSHNFTRGPAGPNTSRARVDDLRPPNKINTTNIMHFVSLEGTREDEREALKGGQAGFSLL